MFYEWTICGLLCLGELAGCCPHQGGRADCFRPLAARCSSLARSAWRSRLGLGGQVLRLLPNEMGCLAGVEASDQAAVELQVSFAPLLSV